MHVRKRALQAIALTAGLGLLATLAPLSPAAAQTTATVSVNAGSSLVTIPGPGVGLNTAVWDGNLLDQAVPKLLTTAGIGALRFPGGSTSDMYNWQTNAIVPGQSSFANSSNTFDAFMGLVKSIGATPVITVNYGSNTAGNAGGDPSFAASWVQYANVTKGYGVKYWEVGNEIYGNGEYGSKWETDLHSALDPTTYGTNVAAFAKAMKAVDSTIKVGVVLTAPGNWPDGQSPDWNSNVLAQCGTAIDFVIVHWYAQNPGNESDTNLLGAVESGTSGSPSIASMMSKLHNLIGQFAGTNAPNVQILVTETNSVSSNPGKQTISIVNAMFVADDVATWLENGVTSVDVWDLHNGSTGGNTSASLFGSATFGDYGILSNGSSSEPAADTPFPTYYGMAMLALLGKAGDTLVSASSSNSLVATHAVAQANGDLALLLINKDPSNTTSATISLAGYTPAASGTVYSYGSSSSAIASATTSGLGASFTMSLPPYSLTTILMTPGSTSPDFSLAATPANLSVTQGNNATATVTVTPLGGFSGSAALAVSGLPSGVTASFSPASTSGTSTLTLSAASTAAAGSAMLAITGTSGSLSHQASLTLTVNAPVPADFSVSASPSSLSVAQGASTSSTITVAPSGGFAGTVALAASGLPSGITASFNPSSTTATSTLSLAAGSTAATGSSSVTVTGTSGSLSHTVTIPLTVSATASAPSAGSGAGPATFTGKAGSNSAWFDEDDVVLSTSSPITALTLTITVPAGNVTYNGAYNTIGSQIAQSHSSGSSIVYTFTLGSGQTIGAGSFTFAGQMNGNGTSHPASGDTWSVTYTAGGTTFTQSGTI
jgi:Glycosyl hydrolase family 79, N-terminal domain